MDRPGLVGSAGKVGGDIIRQVTTPRHRQLGDTNERGIAWVLEKLGTTDIDTSQLNG